MPGDLGQIDAGTGVAGSVAMQKLTVRCMGLFGTKTQAAGGNLTSNIRGGVGALLVTTDVKDAQIFVGIAGELTRPLEKLQIGGSLLGGAAAGSGSILSDGGFGSVVIGGNIVGASGERSGSILVSPTFMVPMGPVTIGGSLIGGSGISSGQLRNGGGDIGAIKIGGNVRGGSASVSGHIFAGGAARRSAASPSAAHSSGVTQRATAVRG